MKIDTREPEKWRSGVKTLAEKEGLIVDEVALPVGDYEGESCIIERKYIADLLTSTFSGRLDDQLNRLAEYEAEDKVPILLVHGTVEDLLEVKMHNFDVNKVYGIIGSCLVRYGINVMWINDEYDAMVTIVKVIKKMDEDKYLKPKRLDKKFLAARLLGIRTWQLNDLMNLYGSLTNIGLCEEKQLMSVIGIGDKKARYIRQILNETL